MHQTTNQLDAKKQQQILQIEAEVRRLLDRKKKIAASATSGADRKRIARQNAIAGAWLRANRPSIFSALQQQLTRAQDRAAFDLPPASSPTGSSAGGSDAT